MAGTQYRFTVPTLPKGIWKKFQEIRKSHGLTQKDCLILGVLAICHLGALDAAQIESLVQCIKNGEFNEG